MRKFYSPWPNSPSSTGEPRGMYDPLGNQFMKNKREAAINMSSQKEVKTYQQYEASGKALHEFLAPLDEIDWPLYENILCGYVPAQYDNGKLGQAGEANHKVGDVYYYDSVMTVGEKYYYLGLLPEFKQ
jgi:hypothetical protein